MSSRPGTQGVYMIGIAAELSGMHPQTLRLYERRGLIQPSRSAGRTRLYSDADVARLRRIQELSLVGLNLAGIERVLELERQVTRAQQHIQALEQELARTRDEHRAQVDQMRRSRRADLIRAPRGETALVPIIRPVITIRGR
jgi:MerR family transcriptional regulator, heat shock protein HspR